MKPIRLNAGDMIAGLANYFRWQSNHMVTEWWIDGGRADLALITRAGYLTEIEIKTSLSDWKHDKDKLKWSLEERPHVSRFFYAVPEEIADKIPEFVPANVGILALTIGRTGFVRVKTIREAARRRSLKISPEEMANIYRACYSRFWTYTLRKMREKREARLMASRKK